MCTARTGSVSLRDLAIRTKALFATVGLQFNVHAIWADARIAIVWSAHAQEWADTSRAICRAGIAAMA